MAWWPFRRREPFPASKQLMREIRRRADPADGFEALNIAAGKMLVDHFVEEGVKRASELMIAGETPRAARQLAIQEWAAVIRQACGREPAQAFRDRMNTLPDFLLMTPEAHRVVLARALNPPK